MPVDRQNSRTKIRYAVVGAGWFGQAAVLPAFSNATENSELVALVSGDEDKREELSKAYSVEAYSYEQYESLLSSGAIDAVYVVSPNTEHRTHTLLAAKHGIHVLCEKPLSNSASVAEEMISACHRHGVHLMTAYRLHFEKANMTAVQRAHDGTIGDLRLFSAVYTQTVAAGNSRLDANLGGHPLSDIGIYCINAARYIFRDEPIEVMGFSTTGPDPRFRAVPEMVSAVLRFPNERLAQIACGFGEAKVSTFQIIGTKGDLRLDPAFNHEGERTLYQTINGNTKEKRFADRDQIGPEIAYFSDCLLNDVQPEPDGREGLIDLRIIEAIGHSMMKGMSIPLQPVAPRARPHLGQYQSMSPTGQSALIHAAPPGG